jgi:subtilisin family serine protease
MMRLISLLFACSCFANIVPTNPPPCTNCALPTTTRPFEAIPFYYPSTNLLTYYNSANAYARSNEGKWFLRNFTNESTLMNQCRVPQEDTSGDVAGHSDINWENAQAVSRGAGVKVGVVDGGIFPHPDLLGHLVNTNGGSLHATAVAGMIHAVAPEAILVSFATDFSAGQVANGITQAVNAGCSIINLSLGFVNQPEPTNVLAAFHYAASSNVLIVYAAENGAGNQDSVTNCYPAQWQEPNGICVGGNTRADAWYSMTGTNTIDLAAPALHLATLDVGREVYRSCDATRFTNWHCYWSGTSASAGIVSGVAALRKANHPNEGYAKLKRSLLVSARPVSGFVDKCRTGGTVDAFRTLQLSQDRPYLIAQQDGLYAVIPPGFDFDIVRGDSIGEAEGLLVLSNQTSLVYTPITNGFPVKVWDFATNGNAFFSGSFNSP